MPLDEDESSIDKLLALTDEGWDIDEQVRTLQIASGEPPSKKLRAIPTGEMLLPNAQDLAPPKRRSSLPPPLPPPARPKSVPPPLPKVAKQPPPKLKKPPPLPTKKPPPLPEPVRRPLAQAEGLNAPSLIELLHARAETLEGAGDAVGLARVEIELATLLDTVLGDASGARTYAEQALVIDPTYPAAHEFLRSRSPETDRATLLAHLDAELASATTDNERVDLLAMRAAALEGVEAVTVWRQALAIAPTHAVALRGLERELARLASNDPKARDALASHLQHMADAYAGDARFAAWLHVERARLLERDVRRPEAARTALERALELDGSIGPVRYACVSFVAAEDDPSGLASLLEEEALLEKRPARAARLELDAARIGAFRLGDVTHARTLLERAAARAPTDQDTDRHVLDELLRLCEAAADEPAVVRTRRARLAFLDAPRTLAEEHRALADLAEKAGSLDEALRHVQAALTLVHDDPTFLDHLDRLLAAGGRHEQRMALWVTEAARNEDAPRRARALVRAARIGDELGRHADAVRHLRSAWVANPGDPEVLDALTAALSQPPSDKLDGDVRALLELYVQGAERARDGARRVAYLEKAALLWEEVLGDPGRALKLYEQVLTLEPDRRGAILGAGRCAERLHNDEALARALLAEARLAGDGADVLALKTRAAAALARQDAPRALALAEEVLAQDHDHAAARALEGRLHEEAGRWAKAAGSLRARIDASIRRGAPKPEVTALWLTLAAIQRDQLHAPADALVSFHEARSADPTHPAAADEIGRLLESTASAAVYRDALLHLAESAPSDAERAHYLVRAGEAEELRLHDDVRAAATYARALASHPGDDLAADRLERVLARRLRVAEGNAVAGELFTHLLRRADRARAMTPTDDTSARAYTFAAADLLIRTGQDLPRARSLLETILDEDGEHLPALRALEAVGRTTRDTAAMTRALSAEGTVARDPLPRLGALWALTQIEGDPTATCARMLDIDPRQLAALEVVLRREAPLAHAGDPRARAVVLGALRTLAERPTNPETELARELRLALSLDSFADTSSSDLVKEAHTHYRAALGIDRLSVTAAMGLTRLSARLRDPGGALAASLSLADIATEPEARSRYLLDGAELLLAPNDALGPAPERRSRAGVLLQRALEADANSMVAASRLATVWTDDGYGERLVDVFRVAIQAATVPDAVIMLGSEIARVARDDLKDLPTAIEAMQRVRAAAPDHIPSLLTLSELCIAQRAWREAVDALETVVATSHDPAPRLTALFALASIYERVLDRKPEAERALRSALAIEPLNPRALRALLRHLAQHRAASGDDTRPEQAQLLEQLADVEADRDQKSELFAELSSLRSRLGDMSGAERALIAAVAHAPRNVALFARLSTSFKTPQGTLDEATYAHALEQLVALGQRLGHVHAGWLATLGQIQVERLGDVREGIAHLQQAITLDGSLTETRFELGSAFARAGSHADAVRTLGAMVAPDPRPLLALSDPAAALSVLEQSMGADHHPEEALAVSELRAISGDLDDGRYAWLRARRPRPLDPNPSVLDRATLVGHVLPVEGRHVMLEVASAVFGIEGKMLRSDIAEIGVSSRDRVSPRAGHPTRALLERAMRLLGLADLELVITPNVPRTRVLTQDAPWIAVPPALVELPEMAQLAAIGRAAARVAFGAPWLEELPAPHIEALLVAAARLVVPSYGRDTDLTTEPLTAQYEGPVAKSISRKQRKALEELAPQLASTQGRPMLVAHLVAALARGELRAAYLLTGDLLSTIDDVRGADPALLKATEQPGRVALAAVLEHPYTGDVARFAISPEAAALKRRLGTSWA